MRYPVKFIANTKESVSICQNRFRKYREWLETNIGEEYTDWKYIHGYDFSLLLPTEEDAAAFKLTFGLTA